MRLPMGYRAAIAALGEGLPMSVRAYVGGTLWLLAHQQLRENILVSTIPPRGRQDEATVLL
jgi:hypothetical protein